MPDRLPFAASRRLLVAAIVSALLAGAASAAAPRVSDEGQLPLDSRLGPLKDLDGYFPFVPSEKKEAFERRAEQVRRRILVATGLWPMPTATPAGAVIHGKVERDGYTVERVYFESYPGHFVSGSLYRPTGKSGKLPGVLCPHGHWANGRFYDAGVDNVRKQIVEGAERFEQGGRFPLQARCVQLARMGCVVFHYDMVGYADSQQIPLSLSHGFSKQRPEFDTPENWGLFSTQAELRQQSVLGLQTYNSIRSLDFLCGLPDVDPSRIGVTGASGGGTQTFLLCAIDPRPAVAFPAVMVSTAMQGGCTCENCCNLRVGTGNVEFAALFAPRALGMSGADDWTKELDTKGLPELQAHYKLLGVPGLVSGKVLRHFGHNYNYPSRELMYHWFNKHLQLGLTEPILEEDYVPLSVAEMTVWDESHPEPPGGPEHERALLKWMTDDANQQLQAIEPRDSASLARFREVYGGGVDIVIGRGLVNDVDIEAEPLSEEDMGGYSQELALLRNKPAGEELPVVFLHPADWKQRVVVWPHEQGKDGLFGDDGKPLPAVRKVLDSGAAVVAVDLLCQGEFLADGKPPAEGRRVNNPREFAGYTWGYNPTLFAQRVHDLLTVISFCRTYRQGHPRVELLALDGAGPWAAAARAQAGEAVARAAIDTGGFRFASLRAIGDLNFLPGGARYGDLPGMLALAAPGELWLAGEGERAPQLVQAAFDTAGASKKLTTFEGPAEMQTDAAIEWLSRP
ncbi:MAG: acetylxylan esterase [Pirellulales bacterium]